MSFTAVLVGVIDVGFFVCLVFAWLFLWRRDVNGPCQLSLALLGVAQLAELLQRWPQGLVLPDPWVWLWRMAFGFVFLYMMVHVAWLIEAARDRVTRRQRELQPTPTAQLASRPGRPRSRQ